MTKQSPTEGGHFDVAIIGSGVVGSAIARELSRYQLGIALVEMNSDVGMGTSKASTAIWHTGYDAVPGSLEAKLLKRSYALMDKFLPEANIAHERLGGILIAWTAEQLRALPSLLEKARENGEMDVEIVSAQEIRQLEPNIRGHALGGLFVPREGILCTYSVPLACAYQSVLNGAEVILNRPVRNARKEGEHWILEGEGGVIRAKYVINAAGLGSDEINALFGHKDFKVTPRRGQLIVFDKLARGLVNHILLPVPSSKTKGVLISPTVYGNILLGPTAEDLEDKSATQTTATGLKMLIDKGREILPQLLNEEITSTYSGLRAATEHSDYQIKMHAEDKYLCVGGIRSTGISAALGIAEFSVGLLREAGLQLIPKQHFERVMMPSIGQAQTRPFQDSVMIARNPRYGEMICHCERVTRAELTDALHATIPATSLDGLRRRTRALQGRCQGFNCHAAVLNTLHPPRVESTAREAVDSERIRGSIDRSAEVLIVGGGPAGLAAAIGLKKLGVKDILVVEREPEAGGMPRMCHHTGFGREDLWRMYSGPRYARYYRELAERAEVEIRTSTTITGWKDHLRLSYTSPGWLGEIEANVVLLATGVRERPRAARLVPGSRPQGVFTTGSLQRFVFQEHLPIGKRAVIVGAELVSLSALMTLMHAGVECAMIMTELPRHQIYHPYLPMKWALLDMLTKTPIVANARISNILGRERVEAVEITHASRASELVACDTVIFTGDWIPEHELARLGGLMIDAGSRGPQIDADYRSSVKGVFAAGNLLRGVATADHCALEGGRAAESIAKYLRSGIWREMSLPIEIASPLVWVCPNIVCPSDRTDRFLFRSDQFKQAAHLQVEQQGQLLHSQKIRDVVVNELMSFSGDWVRKVDWSGGKINLVLV